jgi:predicted amidohydrolase
MTRPTPSTSEHLASVTWGISPIRHVDEFFQHLNSLVERAVSQGASIVMLPELFETELLKTLPDGAESQVAHALAPFAERIDDALKDLAQKHSATIIGGSHVRNVADGYANVCTIAQPDGTLHFQPKNCRTQWEIFPWGLQEHHGLRRLPDSRLGVLICYDSEFPEAARALAEAGTELLCVPSYTETQHGYQRVHWSCRARAVENEIFVAQASIVGEIECFGLGTGYGRSSIIAPSKDPFPPSAILAESPLNQEGIAIATLDFNALAACRTTGDARPWADRHRATWKFLESQDSP